MGIANRLPTSKNQTQNSTCDANPIVHGNASTPILRQFP